MSEKRPRIALRATPCDDPHGPRFEGQYADERVGRAGRLLVVTYNVKKGLAVDQAAVALQNTESLHGADVILLQEMDEAGVEQLARRLRANYVYYPAFTSRRGRNAGNAVLARWPLGDARKVILPRRHPLNGQLRIGVRAVVSVGGGDIVVYSVHTETYTTLASHRRGQVAAIVDDINPEDSPVIVGGDFNTVSGRSVRRLAAQFAAIGLVRVSASAGATIVKLGVRSVVDHVFARGLEEMSSGTVQSADASDHFAVWVRLAVPSPATSLHGGSLGPCPTHTCE